MDAGARKTIIRIELWHGLLIAALMAVLGPTKLLDAPAVLLGGVFMGLNFWLLSYGVAWIITPLSTQRRVKAGIGMLVLKIVVFLSLLATVFFRFKIDPLSFSLGVLTLIVAIVIEGFRNGLALRT